MPSPVDVRPGSRDAAADDALTSGQARALLDAVLGISGDLGLHSTLERIVVAACRLAGARFGALGVLDSTGAELADFITYGVSHEHRELIGPLPKGEGILGLLIDHPTPLRLTDLTTHPDSFGFPPHHPVMTSFLGVPIRIGDRVFGNLYLTQKQGGHDFTDEDESAVVALASTAAVAIENARLYQDLRQREAWLAATADIQRTLLGTAASHDVLHLVVERVCQLTGAQLAAIVLEQDDLSLRIEAVEGSAGTDLEGRPLPKDGAMVDVIDRGATVYLAEGYRLAGLEHLTSALLVPFTGPAGVGGALLVGTTVEPGPQRTRSEIEALHGFAAQASLSLERAQAQEDRATLALQADRDRIARDLHDLVIQRLFATGVSLEGATRMTATEPMISRMRAAITALDETIKEIRETIFELGREPAPTEHTTFRGQLHDVTRASASMLGFPPRLRIDGPVDALVPEDVRPHLVAVLVESLANAARHARASTLLVTISVVVGGDVVLTVEDDGRGFNHTRRHSGLLNMADRAISLGGTCVVDSTPGGGTRVTWRVPIDGPRRDRSTIETLDPSVEPPPAGVLDS